MITDLELVQACKATYGQAHPSLPLSPLGAFCCVSLASDDVTKIVAFRGSITPTDWLIDFFWLPVVVRQHPAFGKVHAGFLADAESIVDGVSEAVGDEPWVCTGHSLGGAEAIGVTALMMEIGRPPRATVTFGCPRFGMAQFVAYMAAQEIRQYRRGNDIVPEVPRDVPPDFAFLDTRKPIQIGRAELLFLSCHHIDGYVQDVGTLLAAAR